MEENIIRNLKKTGVKITAPRKEILKVLSNNPLSAREVRQILKEKCINVDLVTIYRTLELFTDLGITKKILFEDKFARFEIVNGHHHHLVCIKCGFIEDVEVNEEALRIQIEKQSDFRLEKHALEFFGFCKVCRRI